MNQPHILKNALEKEFNIEISDMEKLDIGYSNEVFSAKIGDKQTIIRLSKKKQTYPMEVFVYKELAKRGIPVPKIYYHKENPKNLEWPVMIVQKFSDDILGEIALDANTEKNLYRNAGTLLKKIHEYKIEGFGDLIIDGKHLKGKYDTPKEFWNARTKEHTIYQYLKDLLTNNLVDKSTYELVLQSFNDLCGLQLPEAVFVHGDFHQDHIFTDLKRITGVIDISNGFAGDPRYDIAYTLFFLNTKQRESFLEGYGVPFPDEILLKYLIFIAGEKISWRYKKGNMEGVKVAKDVLDNAIEIYTNYVNS